MQAFKITEDCSPYFIKFYHPSNDQVVERCYEIIDTIQFPQWTFNNHKLPIPIGKSITDLIPLELDFNLKRVSFFVTGPGYYYRPHKDGLDHRFSLNYGIEINDDRCVTSWYSDKELENYQIDYVNGKSRECEDFIKNNHKPSKSMILKRNEAVLFNTDIFHDFDNSESLNRRIILTLRVNRPGRTYFNDAKKIIFGI